MAQVSVGGFEPLAEEEEAVAPLTREEVLEVLQDLLQDAPVVPDERVEALTFAIGALRADTGRGGMASVGASAQAIRSFFAAHPDVARISISRELDEVTIYFAFSPDAPFSAREFVHGSAMRADLEVLESALLPK